MKRKIGTLLAVILLFALVVYQNMQEQQASQPAAAPQSSTVQQGAAPDAASDAETTPDAGKKDNAAQSKSDAQNRPTEPDENAAYTSKDEVALYLHQYGRLPDNFITKQEAEKLGWSGGSLEPYAPGKCIGGNRFGNYEGLLPQKQGRSYTECDIDTLGAKQRGAKRIVFSNDGLIYYTDDHYKSFELLYGDESDG